MDGGAYVGLFVLIGIGDNWHRIIRSVEGTRLFLGLLGAPLSVCLLILRRPISGHNLRCTLYTPVCLQNEPVSLQPFRLPTY